MAEERLPAPVSRRALFAAAAALPALGAIPPPAGAHDIDRLWAQRAAALAALKTVDESDEPEIDRLCDLLGEADNAIMMMPITSRMIAVRRLQVAAVDADAGERYGAPKSASETIAEVIAWLEAH